MNHGYCLENNCEYHPICIRDGVNCDKAEIDYLNLCERLHKIEDGRYMRIKQMELNIEIKGGSLNGNTP